MSAAAPGRPRVGWTPGVALRLGRVSNLPTVWSNVLTGAALASAGAPDPATLPLPLAAMSLMYAGGMFLNDAWDAEVDARERPDRPIPSGLVPARAVFRAGFAMLGTATLLLFLAGPGAGVAGLALAGAIVLYDRHHKANPLSPLLMGACRVLVVVGAALAASGRAGPEVAAAAAALLAYLIGLTYAAKQEGLDRLGRLWPLAFLAAPFAILLPPALAGGALPTALLAALALWVARALLWLRPGPGRRVPRAVVSLIAGIALLDAAFLAAAGAPALALAAVLCFGLTLAGQRWVSGT